jgi:prolyl-tRNA synthetase
MHLSKLFLPVLKENPQEAEIISHRLMLRAGMIRQTASGIYSWLPLGLMVLKNIENIVRKELNKIHCNEVLMATIQPTELWQESGRYEAYGKEMLRITDRHNHQMLYGPTSEEVVTDIFRKSVRSYKGLPQQFYQIQWKFRDEIRPRFGVMRGREFLMKDAYSFDIDFESAKKSYKSYYETYLNIFQKLGVTAIPMQADSGAIGGKLSHEFHILAKTGESKIFYDENLLKEIKQGNYEFDKLSKYYAMADDKHEPANAKDIDLAQSRGIEVGHIFYFGTKYSEKMNAKVMDKNGKDCLVEMGSYGIGISRLVAAIIEASHDENGIIWPEEVAPFKAMIINLKSGDEKCDALSMEIYQALQNQNVTTLYDDTILSIGNKFATADLIGIPYQIIIGPKSAAEGKVEFKNRKSGEKQSLNSKEALEILTA